MSLQYEKEIEQPQMPVEENENLRTAASVLPVYSIVLVVCLIAVSISQFWADGESGILLGGGKSIILAGFDKSLFLAGEFWRILTGAALHGGLVHLAFNCYALFVLGKLIEVLSNRAHLAIVFLLSIIGGGILSLVFLPDVSSVGASGGVVGFLGYLAVYGYRRRQLLTNAFLKNMLFNIGFIALYGYFLREYIDNFGHLGGLLAGAVYGFFQISGDVYKDPREVGKPTEFLGLAALGVFIATSIFSILVISGII